jgi:hypothetical protein
VPRSRDNDPEARQSHKKAPKSLSQLPFVLSFL